MFFVTNFTHSRESRMGDKVNQHKGAAVLGVGSEH